MIDGKKLISMLRYIVDNLDKNDEFARGQKAGYEHVIELIEGSEIKKARHR